MLLRRNLLTTERVTFVTKSQLLSSSITLKLCIIYVTVLYSVIKSPFGFHVIILVCIIYLLVLSIQVFAATDMPTEECYYLPCSAFSCGTRAVILPHQDSRDEEEILKEILQAIQDYRLVKWLCIVNLLNPIFTKVLSLFGSDSRDW